MSSTTLCLIKHAVLQHLRCSFLFRRIHDQQVLLRFGPLDPYPKTNAHVAFDLVDQRLKFGHSFRDFNQSFLLFLDGIALRAQVAALVAARSRIDHRHLGRHLADPGCLCRDSVSSVF